MRTIRCHVDAPLSVGATATLSETATGHLVRVLRLGVGDAVVLFNGDGHDYDARLVATGKRGAEAEVTGARPLANESPLAITLAQGVARGEKMDLVLQKGTELGVAAFAPINTERTEVKLDAERAGKRVAHWRNVIASACEQSARARLPSLSPPAALADAARMVVDQSGHEVQLDVRRVERRVRAQVGAALQREARHRPAAEQERLQEGERVRHVLDQLAGHQGAIALDDVWVRYTPKDDAPPDAGEYRKTSTSRSKSAAAMMRSILR